MVGRGTGEIILVEGLDEPRPRLLIIEGRYYEDVGDALLAGAKAECDAHGVSYEHIVVPGALEIPQVLSHAVDGGVIPSTAPYGRFGGAVALGCVIRGETSHYDIVVNNANHWLMETAIRFGVPLGNGVLTVDTHAQAMARAEGVRAGKGGDAVRACLQVIAHSRTFASQDATS